MARRGGGPRHLVVGAVAALALILGAVTAPATAGAEPPPARRVLLLSLPHLTWADVEDARTPNLRALFADSALANLTVRVQRRATRPAEGYATMGAGTRAVAPEAVAGLAFEGDEEVEGADAAQTYQRRTAFQTDADLVHVALPALVRANDRALFGGEIGTLGEALAAAGVPRAVIANADTAAASRELSSFHREAVLGLADQRGTVPEGRADRGLLRPAPLAPYGVTLDADEVLEAFADAWSGGGVVLVEASDLSRAERFAPEASGAAAAMHRRDALAGADRLAGRLLEHVDPQRDAVIVVAPSSPIDDPHLTVLSVRGPGRSPGLLSSASTRQDGFVVLSDVAPTVLDLLGLPRPEGMEGRGAVVEERGGDVERRIERLADANREARFRDSALGPVAGTFVALVIVLLIVTAFALGSPPTMRRAIEATSLALLAVLPMTYLAALLPAGAGPYVYGLLVGGGAVAVGGGAFLLRRWPAAPIGVVLGFMVTVILVSVMAMGSRLHLSTVFGDSPIVGGRFTGVNNVTFAQLVVGALVLAGLAAHWIGGRAGRLAATAVLVLVLAAITAPMWGADVGGILAGIPAFGLTGLLLWRRKVRLRTAVLAVAVTVGVALALGGLDLLRPEDERTHLGRLLEQAATEGWDGVQTVLLRKLTANAATLTSSVWALLLPPTFAFAGWLAWRAQDRLRLILRRVPELGPAVPGILVAAVLGWALNDSGVAVPGMMLAVAGPVLAYLLMRLTPAT